MNSMPIIHGVAISRAFADRSWFRCAAMAALGALAACSTAVDEDSPPRHPTSGSIDPARIEKHIRALASDEFEGRCPGTRGEERSVEYLTNELKALGLASANPDGTFVQSVPLVGLRSRATGEIEAKGKKIALSPPDDCVLMSRRQVPDVTVDASEIVFAGYGIVAPEYGWDDFKGLDVKGKTILVLVNDPPIPDPKNPSKLDEAMFGGRAMTYYGRWTYKYEIAAEKGAAAVLIVHETVAAAYPWEVVQNSWGQENFDLASPAKGSDRASIEGWIRLDKARDLCAQCGQDYDALKSAALSREFKPVSLGARATFHVQNESRSIASKNVVARLAGADPRKRDECVVYTAHWDHFGSDPAKGIFHGAVDNASGCAAVLEIARVLSTGEPKPARSVLFVFVTGEERGLLGSRFYAANPLIPLEKTLCDINLDAMNPWGRTADIVSVGFGRSSLDEVLVDAAAAQGRIVTPDPEPEKGSFFRSDHFEFAKAGVPALHACNGVLVIGKPPAYGQSKRDAFTLSDYHKPSDVPKPDWDLAGAAADADLLADVGRRVAAAERFPEWKKGSEFQRKAAAHR